MRLSAQDIDTIKSVILAHIEDVKIYLFGSRVDDTKKGGDIDIFVESSQNVTFRDEIKILAKLELCGIYRKVDLVVKTPFKAHQSIYETISKTKVVL